MCTKMEPISTLLTLLSSYSSIPAALQWEPETVSRHGLSRLVFPSSRSKSMYLISVKGMLPTKVAVDQRLVSNDASGGQRRPP
jgi:hypothetical protein